VFLEAGLDPELLSANRKRPIDMCSNMKTKALLTEFTEKFTARKKRDRERNVNIEQQRSEL
jgi:hypothetical protein